MGLNDDATLESFLKFDETTGTTASDEAGLGDYTLYGTPTLDASRWVAGKFGNAIVRDDGLSNYVGLAYDARFNFTVYTWAFWIKCGVTPLASNTIARRTDSNDGLAIYITNNGFIQWKNEKANSPRFTTATTDITDDMWHHVAVVADGTQGWIYVDGIEEAYEVDISAYLGGYSATDGVVLLNSSEMLTSMDDFRIYGRVLTVSEIRQLAYNPYIRTKAKKSRLLGV